MYRGGESVPDAAFNVSLSGGDLSKDGLSKNVGVEKYQAWNYRKAYIFVMGKVKDGMVNKKLVNKTAKSAKNFKPYSSAFTREPFLFYEMRITAKLMGEKLSDEEIIKHIAEENLFQYPTEKSLQRMARACIRRLRAMGDESLVCALAEWPFYDAKQICLYAMMKEYRIIWEFMVTVIGEKYRLNEFSFGKSDVNIFFLRLQEQEDTIAGWSESTIAKLKQVMVKILVENEYMDNGKADHLNLVWLNPVLEEAIRKNHDDAALPAFNCFLSI